MRTRHITRTGSGHVIDVEQPRLACDAICEVVGQADGDFGCDLTSLAAQPSHRTGERQAAAEILMPVAAMRRYRLRPSRTSTIRKGPRHVDLRNAHPSGRSADPGLEGQSSAPGGGRYDSARRAWSSARRTAARSQPAGLLQVWPPPGAACGPPPGHPSRRPGCPAGRHRPGQDHPIHRAGIDLVVRITRANAGMVWNEVVEAAAWRGRRLGSAPRGPGQPEDFTNVICHNRKQRAVLGRY
jgi:hypothetical protein